MYVQGVSRTSKEILIVALMLTITQQSASNERSLRRRSFAHFTLLGVTLSPMSSRSFIQLALVSDLLLALGQLGNHHMTGNVSR